MRNYVAVAIACLTLCTTAFSQASPLQNPEATDASAIPFTYLQAFEHRLGSHEPLRLKPGEERQFGIAVELAVIVSSSGDVISAQPRSGPESRYAAASAEAMTWKYQPFEVNGAKVTASIPEYLSVLPQEILPKTQRAFPAIPSLAAVTMRLERSGCFGRCPAYSVEIRGDGSVVYNGQSDVVVGGEHHDHISAEKVSKVLDAFRDANYFSLEDEYRESITDNPTYVTSLQVDQISKKVLDYVGESMGMPQSVSDLEMTIDRVADTAKWVRGNSETVASLKQEGWDFKSAEAAKTLVNASELGSSDFVRDLVAQGVGLAENNDVGNSALVAAAAAGDRASVKTLISAGAGKNDAQMKTDALHAAAGVGNLELVRMLSSYGGDPRGAARGKYDNSTILMAAVASGVPGVVENILAARPDLEARDETGRTALAYVCQAQSRFGSVSETGRAAIVHLLSRAGANLNAQDDNGNAALHGAMDADTAVALIHDGADINIKNARGETPLMTTYGDDVAKLLVGAGADPHARDDEGRTALEITMEFSPTGDKARYLKSLESASAKQTAKP